MDVTDDQLGTLVVTASGAGWMANKLGLMGALSDKGKAEIRRLWDDDPARRPVFGDTPPASWRAS